LLDTAQCGRRLVIVIDQDGRVVLTVADGEIVDRLTDEDDAILSSASYDVPINGSILVREDIVISGKNNIAIDLTGVENGNATASLRCINRGGTRDRAVVDDVTSNIDAVCRRPPRSPLIR